MTNEWTFAMADQFSYSVSPQKYATDYDHMPTISAQFVEQTATLDLLDLYTNRDGCRTPMQWENSPNGGFCKPGIEPWLPINKNFSTINVANEDSSEGSLLRAYREILKIRKKLKPLHSGRLELVNTEHILAYKRIYDLETLQILINFSSIEQVYQDGGNTGEVIYQIGDYTKSATGEMIIGPQSGLIFSENLPI